MKRTKDLHSLTKFRDSFTPHQKKQQKNKKTSCHPQLGVRANKGLGRNLDFSNLYQGS